MRKFICSICGYIYDEANEKVKWDDLPDDWQCPLCGASKADFNELIEDSHQKTPAPQTPEPHQSKDAAPEHAMRELTNAELSVLCSNLAKGCEKQYLNEPSALFRQLSDYYRSKSSSLPESSFSILLDKINSDLSENFPAASSAADEASDRGAKRALTWSTKVTKILSSLIARYNREGDAMLENTNVFVCDICGFIYIGNEPPAVCPVCKVPSMKIIKIERGQ